MGHRYSPEESSPRGAVCNCHGGVAPPAPKHQARLSTDPVRKPPGRNTPPFRVCVALFALRFYKSYLSLLFAGSCRFQPTCSQYSYQAIERFGLARGCWLTLQRLVRCQPLSRKFGYDPIPESWDEQEARGTDTFPSATTRHEVST
jgi:uncharacterized protein